MYASDDTTYTYDAANRLTARSVSDGRAYTYTWSQRGQLLAENTQGADVRTFTYDGAGRLVEATVFTLTTRFTYNGLGARTHIEVVGLGTTTVTLDYAGGNAILAETTVTGTVQYLYGRDCLGELRDDEWLYYLNDGDRMVRQGTDADGEIVNTWLFDPDGTVLEGPEGPVSHLICGGVYDWSTGLIYKGNRYFDPNLGIWLALTPLVVVQSWRGRKKKGRRGVLCGLALALFLVGVSGVLTGCVGGASTPTPAPTPIPTLTPVCTDEPTVSPTWTPTWTPTPSPTPIPTPTPTPIPWPTPDCTPTTSEPYCINPAVDTEQVMVAHVVLQEGGTTLGPEGMRNIAQIIRNRINDTSGHFPYDTAVGIVSQGNGGAFNAWRAPSAREGSSLWSTALELADLLISGEGTFAHDPGVESCLFFQSCNARDHPEAPEVPIDGGWEAEDSGGGRAQYYYKSLPTYGCVAPTAVP